MSFFDESKNVGLLLIIIAALDIIFTLIAVFAFDGYKDMALWKKIVMIVGVLITSGLYLLLGLDIQNGSCRLQIGEFFNDVVSKFGVLLAITAATGIINIIDGLALVFYNPGSGLMNIVIGVLMLVMAYLMVSGGKEANQVVWVILLILYILMLIGSVFLCLVLIGIPMLLLSIMLLVFLLSPEVKSKMGM